MGESELVLMAESQRRREGKKQPRNALCHCGSAVKFKHCHGRASESENKHGLSRTIPAAVRREVRRRSRFGCVVCRRGFYQYEHIDPPFKEAREHDPERMCCLCGSCHDAVSRGQMSKGLIAAKYREIQQTPVEDVDPPSGPLDFHDGTAELVIGGLYYAPAVRTVLRYHGRDVMRVQPAEREGEPGLISAVFTNDQGEETLRLEENAWIGSLAAWDIEVEGQRITVRRKRGSIALRLRLDPPGRIVVERLDMRYGDAHVLATEETYAVGRYMPHGVHWLHAMIQIERSSPAGAAIEFASPAELSVRDLVLGGRGQELACEDRRVVLNSTAGVMVKELGIAVASFSGRFKLARLSIGPRPLAALRRVILEEPEELCRFISTGTTNPSVESAAAT